MTLITLLESLQLITIAALHALAMFLKYTFVILLITSPFWIAPVMLLTIWLKG